MAPYNRYMIHVRRNMRQVLLFVLVLTVSISLLFSSLVSAGKSKRLLEVHFFDVGQGDSIFIESPSGVQVLIDGGPTREVLRRLGKEMGYVDRTIDLVVATHSDMDHIGGLVDVFERYTVQAILITENENDTPVADAFVRAVGDEHAKVYYARAGQVYDLGHGPSGSTTLTVLFPDRDVKGLESNTASIVLKLSYGESDVLLTGDAPSAIEEYLVSLYGDFLRSEVLKVGHHGSRTSTAETFVSAVDPDTAIISSGRDNRYGHPHKEVLEILSEYGVLPKNTADAGTTSMWSDGRRIYGKE
jgi:competence protein ComEC